MRHEDDEPFIRLAQENVERLLEEIAVRPPGLPRPPLPPWHGPRRRPRGYQPR